MADMWNTISIVSKKIVDVRHCLAKRREKELKLIRELQEIVQV
jgi:hypothetical protein